MVIVPTKGNKFKIGVRLVSEELGSGASVVEMFYKRLDQVHLFGTCLESSSSRTLSNALGVRCLLCIISQIT